MEDKKARRMKRIEKVENLAETIIDKILEGTVQATIDKSIKSVLPINSR